MFTRNGIWHIHFTPCCVLQFWLVECRVLQSVNSPATVTFLVPCVGTAFPVLVYYIAVHVQGCGKGTCASFGMFQSRTSSHRGGRYERWRGSRVVGENADHIIAGDGSVDAAHALTMSSIYASVSRDYMICIFPQHCAFSRFCPFTWQSLHTLLFQCHSTLLSIEVSQPFPYHIPVRNPSFGLLPFLPLYPTSK